MISIVHDAPANKVTVLLDESAADLLIETLQKLKSLGGHLHLDASEDDRGDLALVSPYRHPVVVDELELNLLDPEAWTGG
ncbi:MAG: hypothetical protein KDJ44_21380 [Rhodoblastus sp.]|nr:hypothetical protein [Rhodoblastus sp.]